MRSQVSINNTKDLTLNIIDKISSFVVPHLALNLHMYYGVECLCPNILDCCMGLLTNMKSHLIDYKMG